MRLLAICTLSALVAAGLLMARETYLTEYAVDPDQAIVISSAQRLISERGEIPERWERRTLPDDWLLQDDTTAAARTVEWYRHELFLNVPPDRLWGIYLSAVNLNAAVYLNGKLVGLEGRVKQPLTHNWNRPLMFSLPSGLLKPGRNEISIEVVTYPAGHGFLGPIYLAPHEELAPLLDRVMFLNVGLARFQSAISLMMGLVIMIIWLMRHKETEYSWFALTLFFWGLHSLKYHVTNIPVSSLTFAWFLFLTAISACFALYMFLQRFIDRHNRRADYAVFAMWLLSGSAISIPALLGSDAVYTLSPIGLIAAFTTALVGFVSVVRHTLLTSSTESRWLVVAISFLSIIIAHDVAMIFGFIDRTKGQMVVYAVPVLMGAFSGIMLQRFVQALVEREQIMQNLQDRAEAAAARVVELEKASALAEQRETIMRDMHDGVGGQLVSSLALLDKVDAGNTDILKSVLQQALTDLRLMIDSLDTDAGDLNLLVGAFRDRMRPILAATGYEVTWTIDELPNIASMTPHKALQILRILQEAITNAIKHAQATRIDLDISHDHERGEVSMNVTDDGTGFDANGAAPGRGLLNMQRRAANIGAQWSVAPGVDGGSSVTLLLPVE